MRSVAAVVVLSAVSFNFSCGRAFGIDEKILDDRALSALVARAEQAEPREQCFLYAELTHQMTELAGRQLSVGDREQASDTLRLVRFYAEKIHMGLSADSKKLKNAELLMQHTSFRLRNILDDASYEDRETMQATLRQLEDVQTELMMRVFDK